MEKIYQELEIYRPCISKKTTQYFGANLACINSKGQIYGIAPGRKCPGRSYYESLGMKGHSGNDLSGLKGEDIYHAATFDGWWRPDHDSQGGLGVDVVSNEPLFFPRPIPSEIIKTATPHVQNGVHGFTHHVKMRYWHLSMQLGNAGKDVSCGAVIGLMGNTGASSGVHLHFAPKWCLPTGEGVGNSNGYVGAFDPKPYYKHETTAKEHMEMLRLPVVELTEVERKDLFNRLSKIQLLILAIQKLINKL